MSRALADPIGGSFREDAPRPPVPGEEGEAPCGRAAMRAQHKAKPPALASLGSPAKRNEDGLGEPEGSASPDSPLARWTKSLHSLLGDQDGAHLFRIFLERERCVDTLDFWFACNGFRQMDIKDAKTLRVAKAIYKRYIENNCIVAKQLKTATKTYIRDNVKRQQIDSAMFDQAQTEVQTAMEDNAYQAFLTSDMYLEYVHAGCENPAHVNPNGLGSLKLMCGYLPTLNEEEEWTCGDFKTKALAASVVGLSAKALRATACLRTVEALDNGYRSCRRGGDPAPRQASAGYVCAPASSAHDSEVSSDALTDDSMSVTDSSVDGIPPYSLGSRKFQQKEMQRSMKLNGQVTLPHFPRTRRLPKEMAPVVPAAFAAQLISRLERLKRERDTMSSLEERLQQIQEEEEREEADLAGSSFPHPPHLLGALSLGPGEEDPQAILDEHLSRVLKTPGCQSPGAARHSPRSRSRSPDQEGGDGGSAGPRGPLCSAPGPYPPVCGAGRVFLSKQPTRHIHHHYIHHHTTPKTQEQVEAEAAQRVQSLCAPPLAPAVAPGDGCSFPRCWSHCKEPSSPGETALSDRRSGSLSKRVCKAVEAGAPLPGEGGRGGGGSLQLPSDTADRSQNVWQWILDSDRQSKHKLHSPQGPKKGCSGDPPCRTSLGRAFVWGGGGPNGQNGHARVPQPSHPFIQDPAMPPLSPPNTLAQLEEASRRLEEEVSKPAKQRHSTSSLQRDRSHFSSTQNGGALSIPAAHADEPNELKKAAGCQVGPGGEPKVAGCQVGPGGELVVTYFFCGEEIPYRRMMKAPFLTLAHFKEQLQRKGNYRYYFKKASDEFECGAVFEEVWDDRAVLPMFEGRILGKVERMG